MEIIYSSKYLFLNNIKVKIWIRTTNFAKLYKKNIKFVIELKICLPSIYFKFFNLKRLIYIMCIEYACTFLIRYCIA